VSRERLLILDPHYEWSKTAGPWFDFVENSDDLAIQNHMSAFKAVMEHLERPLDGTVIRIPLRNQARASESEICPKRETTVSELSEVLESFAVEFGETGLLFMRNIEKLEIKYSDKSITIEMSDLDSLRR
jgi:sacsin